MTLTYPNAHYLAEPEWLYAHLDDDLRVIDARFDVRVGADGTFEEVSGRADYLEGHIPRAQFVDLYSDLTDPKIPTRVIGPEAFEALMGHLGIGSQSTVVIYDDRGGIWAARLWWALRYYGHDKAKMLNGGLTAWRSATYTLNSDVITPLPVQFTASPRAHLRVEKEDVLAAIADPAMRIIDALPAPFYHGQASLYPGHRKGHVPGAHNIPAQGNLDPETLRVKPMDVLCKLWAHADIGAEHKIITYCGSGIFGSFALFILTLMGHEKTALYDASWMEWGRDDKLPIATIQSNPKDRKTNQRGK